MLQGGKESVALCSKDLCCCTAFEVEKGSGCEFTLNFSARKQEEKAGSTICDASIHIHTHTHKSHTHTTCQFTNSACQHGCAPTKSNSKQNILLLMLTEKQSLQLETLAHSLCFQASMNLHRVCPLKHMFCVLWTC